MVEVLGLALSCSNVLFLVVLVREVRSVLAMVVVD